MAGIVCHVCKTEQCWVCMACSSFKLCCEVLLLLNMADMDCFHVEDCGVRSAVYHVHLVGVNRLSACREFFGVH